MNRYYRLATESLIAFSLLMVPTLARAFITVNEGLPTTKDAIYVGTTTPQVLLNGGTFYAGTVPSVSLKASSNVVIGNDACVIYATGSITCLGVNLSTAGTGPFVMRTGDTMTGPLSISATGAAVYDLSLSTSISFTQSAGNGLGIRWGDGSISTTASSGGGGSPGPASSMTITAVSDSFLGQVTGSLKTFTLSNTPANAAALTCVLDGLLLSQTSDYAYTPPSTIALTTAPAANSTGFFCNYFVNTSTLPAAAILSSPINVFIGSITASNISRMIASYDFNTAGQSVSSVSFVANSVGVTDYSSATWTLKFVGISTNSVHWFMSFNNVESASYVNGTYGLVSSLAGLTQTESSYNLDYCAGGVLSGVSQDYSGEINFRTVMGSKVKMITDSRTTMSSFNSNVPALSINGGTITLSAAPTTISLFTSTDGNCGSGSVNHIGSLSKIHAELWVGPLHQ